MGHLSRLDSGRLASAREIANLFDVPTSLLMNVLKQLASVGYIDSVRGARGGYRMAVDPEEISLADLVGVLEGPVRLAECVTEVAGDDTECTCKVMANCPVTDPVHRVQRKLKDFLAGVTLGEIVNPPRAPAENKG